MSLGADQRRPLPQRRVDFRLRHDQVELENLHLELCETSPELRPRVRTPASIHIQNREESAV